MANRPQPQQISIDDEMVILAVGREVRQDLPYLINNLWSVVKFTFDLPTYLRGKDAFYRGDVDTLTRLAIKVQGYEPPVHIEADPMGWLKED